jgi:hypothetical protein
MVVKIVRAVWFISLLVAAAYLLYVYAGLPESVDIGNQLQIERSVFFYLLLLVIGAFNALGFVIRKLFQNQPDIQTWFFGLLIFFHLFLIVALTFTQLTNSLERFDYERMGFLINTSVALLVVWAFGYPLFQWLQKKLLPKAVHTSAD